MNDRESRVIVPDPDRAPLVRKAFEVYATGNYTLDQLAAVMGDAGLTNRPSKRHPCKAVSRAQWHRLLTNPIFSFGVFDFDFRDTTACTMSNVLRVTIGSCFPSYVSPL